MTADPLELRMAQGYQPNFDIDVQAGTQAELLYVDIVAALRDGSAEVKHDMRASRYGNYYFEYECLRRDGWNRSGIAVSTSEWWAVVAEGVLVAAPTDRVRAVVRRHGKNQGSRREETDGDHPTKGVVIPVGRYLHDLIHWETS